ncbi:MAG TPA: hypothetical protein H9875_04310 [Candidatus Levilactobacillus faecigallinarum]|uniref:Uncharacterized protein n=1 Tax=Candidatus Levilactobacillus faecigallinarum TaxID=2838638 RepID=A0A9D1U4X0_9LACO|nr:hypothetical protein [Candidatus Levilactobacillus faecigallinarum]
MSANSRMERYHSAELDAGDRQPAPQQQHPTYQRRPGLAKWVALLVAVLTLTIGLRLTAFNASYTAGVVSRSAVGEKVINRLNNDLSDLGITGDPVTASLAQPYLAQGINQLYGKATTSVDATELANAISAQASSMGTTASTTLTTAMAKTAQKLVKQAFNTTAMQAAAVRLQRAMKVNLWVMIGVSLLLVVTLIYAVGMHHFLGSLGPGLALGGLLVIVIGIFAWLLGVPLLTAGTTGAVNSVLTTIGHSSLGVVIFGGVAEVVLGLLVLLGHRTFRNN